MNTLHPTRPRLVAPAVTAALVSGLFATGMPLSAHAADVAADLTAQLTAADAFVPTALTLHGGRANQELGTTLNTGTCDVDADGLGDVSAVGALALGRTDYPDMAAARRVAGHSDALTDLPLWTNWTTDGTTGFTCAGDVNGDGFDDLVEVPAASARVVAVEQSAGVRNASGKLVQNRVQRTLFPTGSTQLGARALGAAGDVDGDGVGDVLVSQHTASTAARSGNGRLWVLRGESGPTVPASVTTRTLDASAPDPAHVALVVDGAATGDQLGVAVAVGDQNGDGIDDVAVASDSGTVWLAHGRAAGSAPRVIDLADLDPADGSVWVSGATGLASLAVGDVDGDGTDDLVLGLGAVRGSDGAVAVVTRPGAQVDVAAGSVRAAGATAGYVVRAERAGDELGASVAVAGDLDGDGRDDLLVGAPGHDVLEAGGTRSTDTGAAYVLAGRAGGEAQQLSALTPTAGHRIDGTRGADQSADRASRFGTRVAAVGDVDGNGSLDLAISAPGRSDHATYRQGAVTVALRGELGSTLAVVASRRVGDGGKKVADGSVLKASDVLDLRAELRLSTQQGVAGEVRFALDGQPLATASATPSAPHRSFAHSEEVRITAPGEHVLSASADAVPGTRGAATAAGTTVLVTDATRTQVERSGSDLLVTVRTATAGTPAEGTVDVHTASGAVLATGVALVEGKARVGVPAGTDPVGAVASFTGTAVEFGGQQVTLLAASTGTVAAPAPAQVTASVSLSRATARFGDAVTATLSLDRAVTGTAQVLVDGRQVGTARIAGTRATLTLPRTLAVGTRTVQVKVAATATTRAATASTRLTLTRATSGTISASSAKFRRGSRPVVTVRVARASDGTAAAGTVVVKVGTKKYKASLTSAKKGVVKVRLGARRTAATAKVTFTPKAAGTYTTPKRVQVKLRPRG